MSKEEIQVLKDRLQEVATDWQVNQLKLAKVELTVKKLREVASSAQFFADEVQARSNDSFLIAASSSLKSDAEDAIELVHFPEALDQWFVSEVNRREDTTFLNPRCPKCDWNHNPNGKCLTL
jgi:hypothetical protein